MANTEYITAPVFNDGSQSNVTWYDANIAGHTGSVTFERGNSKTWTSTNSGGAQNGDVFSSAGASMGASSSGKSWEFIYKLDTSKNGLFPSMKNITGFQFDFQQTSTSGHAYWLRNVGIETCNSTGGNNIKWCTNDMSKRGETEWHRNRKYLFSSSDNTAFQNQYFYRVWFFVSTSGGSFTANNTYVNIQNFKLIYNCGSGSGNRWVVGKYRNKNQAGDESIQGK